MVNSLKKIGENTFVSGDIFREQIVKQQSDAAGTPRASPGLSSTYQTEGSTSDLIVSFACKSWPRDADEWVTRTRLFGWPPQKLIDRIVRNGFHLVPLRGRHTKDEELQWRISLASAERSLVHAFSHSQLKVYCLLKYFFTQLDKTQLQDEFTGYDGIISLSVLKMLMFFSVENSHPKLWQEQNLFYCFWFCFNILMTWVKRGTCPNYFISSGELFQQEFLGNDQQRFLDILTHFHSKKLQCISHERFLGPKILESVCDAKVQAELLCPYTEMEMEYYQDMGLFVQLAMPSRTSGLNFTRNLTGALSLLMNSKTEVDDVITFSHATSLLAHMTQHDASPYIMAGTTGNKTRYASLRKCKNHLTCTSSVSSSELCYLANFHFLSGNYNKSLELCRTVVSQPLYHMKSQMLLPTEQKARYIKEYCGKGYTLFYKLKKTFTKSLSFEKDCLYLPQLHPEVSKSPVGVRIPTLPYAVFLSFLCCHELGDTLGRDNTLRNLIVVKYDYLEGGHTSWMVHTLLGICYETLGDHHRAIRCYTDSKKSKTELHEFNPASERIEALKKSETR
ncbi:uncharacterized protein LOC117327219 [Pecten maximus]|uniref:uncharacterized protein LOC117327219 n=1 Tax=Pecten maximus TaxID=6579 RepID=UPI001458A51A|nr:uncharacterized protein LOC117327219 [Pecten maximus]XP_033739982.1 uncharacterized protein LOC117327219 [Pecten maximus]